MTEALQFMVGMFNRNDLISEINETFHLEDGTKLRINYHPDLPKDDTHREESSSSYS